jgi:hypothetical protein
LTKDQQIIEPDWEIYLRDTARMIGEQQTPQRYVGFYSYFGSRIFFPEIRPDPKFRAGPNVWDNKLLGRNSVLPLFLFEISFFCRILEARERLYELIAHCIPAEVIFKVDLLVL